MTILPTSGVLDKVEFKVEENPMAAILCSLFNVQTHLDIAIPCELTFRKSKTRTDKGPACIKMKSTTQRKTKFSTQQILAQPQATHLDLCFGIPLSTLYLIWNKHVKYSSQSFFQILTRTRIIFTYWVNLTWKCDLPKHWCMRVPFPRWCSCLLRYDVVRLQSHKYIERHHCICLFKGQCSV